MLPRMLPRGTRWGPGRSQVQILSPDLRKPGNGPVCCVEAESHGEQTGNIFDRDSCRQGPRIGSRPSSEGPEGVSLQVRSRVVAGSSAHVAVAAANDPPHDDLDPAGPARHGREPPGSCVVAPRGVAGERSRSAGLPRPSVRREPVRCAGAPERRRALRGGAPAGLPGRRRTRRRASRPRRRRPRRRR
jgi:hypothetical protein